MLLAAPSWPVGGITAVMRSGFIPTTLFAVVGGGMVAAAPDPRSAPVTPAVGFTLCHTGGGIDCVVDGDTIWIAGEKVRIADIDAPETHPPRCAEEAEIGRRANRRLQALLNAGTVTLSDEGRDRYGRRLAVVSRNGRSLGMALVAEGLARPWEGRRRPWCAQA